MEKKVKKLIKDSNDAVILKVKAGVRTKCGERIYDKATHEKI